MTQTSEAEALARRFHEYYEEAAPDFGYETRQETRQFDPNSKNGRLMVYVCGKILTDFREHFVDRAIAEEITFNMQSIVSVLTESKQDTSDTQQTRQST